MTKAAQQLLDSFEALPEEDKQEVLVQLLQKLVQAPYAALSEEALLRAADVVFQDYDLREAEQ